MSAASARVPPDPQCLLWSSTWCPTGPWSEIAIDSLPSACWKHPNAAVEINPFVPVQPIQLCFLVHFTLV